MKVFSLQAPIYRGGAGGVRRTLRDLARPAASAESARERAARSRAPRLRPRIVRPAPSGETTSTLAGRSPAARPCSRRPYRQPHRLGRTPHGKIERLRADRR